MGMKTDKFNGQTMPTRASIKGFLLRFIGLAITLYCGVVTIAGFATLDNPIEIVYALIFLALTVGIVIMMIQGRK